MSIIYSLDEIRSIATPIAQRHGVDALYLFGSYARGDATSESDLDFMIEKGRLRTALQIGGMWSDLEDDFGKEIDLITTGGVYPPMQKYIDENKILIYKKT